MEAPFARLGFHYFADDSHYTERDLADWLPVLRSHAAKWIVLRAARGRLIPEFFLQGLLEAEIQPVVWIHSPIGKTRAKDLATALNSYKRLGIEDVVVFDRPNMRESWPLGEWNRTGLVERFIDRLLPILQIERAIGLHPIFPPLEPGGDYWDTAFLEASIESMMRRGHHDLLRDMRLAVYAWTFGKPLSWGAGGPERWTETRPYHTPDGAEDQRGFHLFEWYAAILERTLGTSLPMLAVSGGALRGDPLDLQFYREQTLSVLRALENDQIPEEVYAFGFYPLMAQGMDALDPFAWYASPDTPQPVALSARRETQAEVKRPFKVELKQPIEHYWLVAKDTPEISLVGLLAQADQAVIGFSSDQARLAKKVTIVGPVPASIERKLRKSGAEVSRFQIPAHRSGDRPTEASSSPA